MEPLYLSVRQLNFYVRSLLEGDKRLVNVTVTGEISGFKNHYQSGHLYFTLKDNDASVRCVMFKANAISLKFPLSDGMQVVLKGRASLYERDGQYQLYAEEILPYGKGDIYYQLELVKQKLKSEGLFDESTKRRLPQYPEKIAVITSATGAAVKDIINILSRRWPIAEILLCPVTVQGETAAAQMISTLDKLYSLSEIDVAIIGRGGGSTEDLWAFNDEKLARKIYESPFPIISAVGHETDFTLCDFVSDLRAPTPSAAAELAVPDINEVTALIKRYEDVLKSFLISSLNLSKAKLERIENSRYFKEPVRSLVYEKNLAIDCLAEKFKNLVNDKLSRCQRDFQLEASRLDSLSPLKILARGYAVASKDNINVLSTSALMPKDTLNLRFSDGSCECTVEKIYKE